MRGPQPARERPRSREEASMRHPRRLLVLAVACQVVVGAGVATAQTVMVRNAAPGTTVEVLLNGAEAGTATADASGHATLAVRQPGSPKDEMAASLFVDTCEARRRVHLVERGVPAPAPAAGCTRQAISGVFVVRPVSTLVVNVAAPRPRLLLRQGAFDPDAPPRVWEQSPSGFMVFGGAGLTWLSNATGEACGNVADCQGDGSGLGYMVGAAYWFKPYLGVEAAFVRPAGMSAEGSGNTYRFTSTLETSVATLSGLFGLPVGPIRLYGKGGANQQRSLLTTTQTIDDTTITIDEVTQTIPGATQTLERRTGGWAWQFGGGAEFWPTRFVALFGEFGFTKLKGTDLDEGEGLLDDRAWSLMVGARVRLGR